VHSLPIFFNHHFTEEQSDSDLLFQNDQRDKERTIDNQLIRFLKLYTSKPYDNQRCNLLSPPSEGKTSRIPSSTLDDSASLKKHVLSPRLVHAISSSMELVWANCERQEGLLGRSDTRLQTAVGMPVAVDSSGNICIVIMFSRNYVQSNDDAIEYLQFIRKSATSHSIPGLLPIVNEEDNDSSNSINIEMMNLRKNHQVTPIKQSSNIWKKVNQNQVLGNSGDVQNRTVFPEGVTTRYMSLNIKDNYGNSETNHELESRSEVEVHSV